MMDPGLTNLLYGVGWRPWSPSKVFGAVALVCGLPFVLIAWWLW